MLPLLAALLFAAEPSGLRLEDATFRQFEDGPPFEGAFRPGEQLFFDLRVAGYGRTDEESPSLRLKWTVRATDSAQRPLEPAKNGQIESGLAAQDREYRPRVHFLASIPPFALEGTYQVSISLTDEVAEKSVEQTYSFRVRGKQLAKDAPLAAGNLRFYRKEDDPAPLQMPVYAKGSDVWLRFDLEGFSRSASQAFSVNYGVMVTGPDGQQFLKQDPAAAETGQPAYPQEYVPATFVIQLPPGALPGLYRIAIMVRDLPARKEQTTETTFRVE